ncbi:MAG TPA: ABC transporter substrate-binding protein [Stellaceae bacterium]|nr:ABC transporter substrate-binding protein [Stellaceae bacterium]
MIRILAVIALLCAAAAAQAADALRVGRSPGFLFAYTPLDVGIAQGFFQKRGLAIRTIDFEGAAKMDAGLVAGSIDISLGSPMGMAMVAKGMPAVGVAVIAGPMLEFGVIVPWDSPLRTLDDLKGKTIGIATKGSITEWVALELARVKGWGGDGIKLTSLGSGNGVTAAALKAHLVDALIGNATTGMVLEREKRARLIGTGADFVAHFMAHEIYATRALVRDNPEAIRRFLAGWMEAVAYMRANRDAAIRIARTATGLSEADEAQEYDRLMPGMSADGRFDPRDIERIGQSYVELGILDKAPDMAALYTEAYLPKK